MLWIVHIEFFNKVAGTHLHEYCEQWIKIIIISGQYDRHPPGRVLWIVPPLWTSSSSVLARTLQSMWAPKYPLPFSRGFGEGALVFVLWLESLRGDWLTLGAYWWWQAEALSGARMWRETSMFLRQPHASATRMEAANAYMKNTINHYNCSCRLAFRTVAAMPSQHILLALYHLRDSHSTPRYRNVNPKSTVWPPKTEILIIEHKIPNPKPEILPTTTAKF
jgi:hypothetical protein